MSKMWVPESSEWGRFNVKDGRATHGLLGSMNVIRQNMSQL